MDTMHLILSWINTFMNYPGLQARGRKTGLILMGFSPK